MKPQKSPDNMSAILKQEGVFGLCTDLITHDQRFNVIFSYIFGPTIVVKNIETARRIGIGTVRMVTLDGDLVESSGAMTGGYKKESVVGAFKDDDSTKKLDNYREEVESGNSLLAALQRKKLELEESVQRHRTLKAEIEAQVITLSKTLKLDETDTKELKENKKKLGERLTEIDDELNKLSNTLGQLNKEAVQKKISRQMLKNQVNELRNPLKLAELNTLESEKQSSREQVIKIDSEVKSLDIQIKEIIAPEEEKMSKILKQIEKEELSFKEEIKKFHILNETLTKDIHEKETKQKEFYAKFKEAFNKRAHLVEQVKSNESKIMKNFAETKINENKITMIMQNSGLFRDELSLYEKEFEQYKELPLPESDKSESEINADISRYEKRVLEMGNVNMKSLEIYAQVEEEYTKLKEKKETLTLEKEDILVMINEIETNKKEIFMKTFAEVNEKFKRIFVTLSTKGEAFLALDFPENPFEGGMTMKVKLNTNKFMDIRSLSGGEKTMTALALLFAIQEYEPASFYVLDEVDAALDKRNSEKLADLVKQYTSKAQYIMISHNDGVIAASDTLFGVSMDEHGISKVTSLKV
jgi:chromosome segregation protein